MKLFMFLLLVGIHGTAAMLHSLQYFYTASTGLEGQFPAFVAVGIVDGNQIDYYDSVSEKNVLKQTWMKGVRDENGITDARRGHQQTFASNVQVAMQRFNQTAGVHINQIMYGCEWDDETNKVNGFNQHGYDGEDWISFDLKTETFITPVQQAVITKNRWNNDKAEISLRKNYLTQICPEWLKKYVNYGRRSLMRKDLPSVSLLQKTPSSPVSCHATGFYPNRADLIWTKDGVEIHENVDKGEILPNHDGTFQMSVDLKISSIAPEDWKKYDCVFQLSGVKDDVTKLDKSVIRTNKGSSGFPVGAAVALGVLGLFALIACIAAAVIYGGKNKGFSRASNSDTSSSSAEDPDPKKKISDEKKAMI